MNENLLPRVFTEVTFWNSAESGILCEVTLLPRDSADFSSVFPYMEFHKWNLIGKFIQETLDFFIFKTEVHSKNINQRPFFKKYKVTYTKMFRNS
jgi:hypothetical protein